MKIFCRNNLDKAVSPYLRQHKDNPVWWQEWSEKALAYARETGKFIFVSVGYATCHWCHVMAKEAFSDPEVAAYLNEHFVSIKVDREMRPDIDHFLMSYLVAVQGQGGWPLNAFLTPGLRPLYALTYAPLRSREGLPDFLEILKQIKKFHDQNTESVEAFSVPVPVSVPRSENEVSLRLQQDFDPEYAGFGMGQKFPSFCTLLFMLSYGEAARDTALLRMCTLTLDRMAQGGLHDHLQGGFFRYCVDREWTIPHFEKMLYDQAMALWVYSQAFRVLNRPDYGKIAEKILRCLDETFAENGLYLSALDADTDHEEGVTYLWGEDQLRTLLTPEEFERFRTVYRMSAGGNFEGRNHLLKKGKASVQDIEEKLLCERRERKQPEADKKLITSQNALAGIALIHAYRFLGRRDCLEKSRLLAHQLMKGHIRKGRLAHSSCGGVLQREEFLQDVAGLLLLLTYLHEEDGAYDEEIRIFEKKLQGFKSGEGWLEIRQNDFGEIPDESIDQPAPSGVSMAELAQVRVGILKSADISPGNFKEPHWNDFFNYAVLIRNGYFHVLTTPERLPWQTLPTLSIQLRGKEFRDCYRGACRTTLS
jgi:uncharacterized protein YyaL (SSP411 family)